MTSYASTPIPKNTVSSVSVPYETLLMRARGGPEEPYRVYDFGDGRKTFWSNYQEEGIYGKPVSISGGVTTHLPDPELKHNPFA